VGLPLAYVLAQRRGWLSSIIEALISLPLVLPPTVLGFYLLLVLSHVQLAFTFTGLLLASLLYSLPFALQPFLAAFQGIDRDLVEASWTLGESTLATFLRVTIPLALPGIVSGAVLAFAHTLGEFGVVLMIGGNIPGVSRTLSVSIYDSVESLDYVSANRTAVLLLAVSLAALLLTAILRRRSPVNA
jgi:molybdate transport system permease protein